MAAAAPDRSARRRVPVRGTVGAALLLLGLLFLGLWRVTSGSERLPFAKGSPTPPASVRVTQNSTYSIAVPGGMDAYLARNPSAQQSDGSAVDLSCQWTPGSGGSGTSLALTVTPESADTKATEVIAHFTSPYTGPLHVDCSGWGAVFVPDSDDRPADTSGWFVVLATLCLTVGIGLALSALRLASLAHAPRRSDEDAVPLAPLTPRRPRPGVADPSTDPSAGPPGQQDEVE